MKPLSYNLVLAWACLGAFICWGVMGALGFGELGYHTSWVTGGWAVVLAYFPFFSWVPAGAILGVRMAAGKGGTARWTALLASWVLWDVFAWVLTLPVESGLPGPVLVASGAALIGGWSSLVWRSMRRLSGEPASTTTLSLAFVGVLGSRLMFSAGFWVVEHAYSAGLLPTSAPVGFGMFITLLATVAVCGVGAMASLAGRLDLPWTGVVASAGVMALLMGGSIWVLDVHMHLDAAWSCLPFMLLEIAWFAWWGHRLAREEEA